MANTAKNSSELSRAGERLRAVFMLRRSPGVSPDGYAKFDFRGTPLSEITRIEWPATVDGVENSIALVPGNIAGVLIANGYARQATEAEEAAFLDAHFGKAVDIGAAGGSEEDTKSPAPASQSEAPVDTSTSPPSTDGTVSPVPADGAAPAAPVPPPVISIEAPSAIVSPSKASIPPAPNGDSRKGGKRK